MYIHARANVYTRCREMEQMVMVANYQVLGVKSLSRKEGFYDSFVHLKNALRIPLSEGKLGGTAD